MTGSDSPTTGPSAVPDDDFTSEVLRRLAEREKPYARYQLEGEVAQGGQGAILRVWDEDLQRHLAMKVVGGKGEAAKTGATPEVDSRTLGRFLEEAQVTGQLDHPGIVPVHELGLDSEGRIYFTMKLVKGRDLKTIFELVHEGKEGWTQTRTLDVLLRVCEAMAYAHSKGVIHRDLKPGNVMVGKYGEVFVMDWGLARVVGREDRKDLRIQPEATTSEVRSKWRESGPDSPLITMDGTVVGTPAYMSPEQALGRSEEMGPHSDVYSAGAMLYHLLAGHMPYVEQGMRVSNRAIWYQVQKGPPDPISQEAPGAPSELVAICEKAMARDVSRRYRDTSELAEDLRAFLEHRVVSAYRTGALAELWKWVERNMPLATSLAAGILVLMAGFAASWVLKGRADRSAALAAEREKEAKKQQAIAVRERANVLKLSAFQQLSDFQRLDDLRREADALWPPWPDHLDAYDAWLDRARDLVASLETHRQQLEALRARTAPFTEQGRELERRAHPRFVELENLRARVHALARAHAVRNGEATVQDVRLDEAMLPSGAEGLEVLAWPLVDPERTVFGEEARGLALARLAIERVEDERQLARAGQTLAWALHANGLDAEAIDEMQSAILLAPDALRRELEPGHVRLKRAIAAVQGRAGRATLESLEKQLAVLDSEVSARREWRFTDPHERWWHTQLVKLMAEIEAFAHPETGLIEGISPAHGWGVLQRLEWSENVDWLTVSSDEARVRWSEAIASIADRDECPAYDGLALTPQLGLLPIGRDSETGLWEFAHPLTGEIPERDDEGRLILTEETGLVFVLLPGGTFVMGTRSGSIYSPFELRDEIPLHEVTLSPFFLSKYEMTQGQWQRFTGENPSENHGPDTNVTGRPVNLSHPVEQVSWYDGFAIGNRMGLKLPSEAEWEYGARGGTTSSWWTGDDPESLAGAENLAGDSNAIHTPAGAHAPNPFGLHDVHGNVREWCLDGYERGFYARSPRVDPVSDPSGSRLRVARGGSFGQRADFARSAIRYRLTPEYRDRSLGLRPARVLRGAIR